MTRPRSSFDPDGLTPVIPSAEWAGRSDFDAGASEVMQGTYNSWQRLARDQRGYATTNALVAIARGLSVLPGRKTMIVFAERLSIPDSVSLRLRERLKADGSSASSLATLELNEDVLRGDPRTSFRLLAEPTGGFLIDNTNHLSRGMTIINADRRFHYLLTYTPEERAVRRRVAERDGARPRSPGGRAGAERLPRRAGTRDNPGARHEGPALAALDRDPPPTDLPITARAFVFPTGDEAQLAVLASTPASAITFASDDKGFRADFTILARILDANGEVVRKASEPYRLSGPLGDKDKARRGDVLFFRQPTLPAGRYTLDAVVHDALGKKAGVVSESFEVPAASGLAVSSLMVVGRGERVADPQPDNPLYVGNVLVYPNLGEPIDARSRAASLQRSTMAAWRSTRITVNPDQMGGVPCLRGLRIPVATIVALVAEGQPVSAILADYPDLEAGDVREALLFAAEAVRERALPLTAGE